MNALPFILASSSPRRLSLLKDIGIVPSRVIPADIDETPLACELPRCLALRLAKEKLVTVVKQLQEKAVVLASDTVVACGRRVLPKAETDDEVRTCLHLLSGRRHHVFTAVAVQDTKQAKVYCRLSDSNVNFARLSEADIEHYVSSKEGIGKAGGYAIQGLAATYIKAIGGSYSGIVGLPLFETSQLLRTVGYLL